MPCRPVLAPGLEELGSRPRTREKRDGSQLRRPPRPVVPQRILGQSIQLPSLNVSLKLAVPDLSIKSGEPLAQLRQLLPREFFDLALDDFQFAHELPQLLKYIRAALHRTRRGLALEKSADGGIHNPDSP